MLNTSMAIIRPYQPDQDAKIIHQLWQQTIGHDWPITEASLTQIIDPNQDSGQQFLAEQDGLVIGFTSFKLNLVNPDVQGQLVKTLVHPHHQGRGIGGQLIGTIEEFMRDAGAKKIRLGSGVGRFFWPGVPLMYQASIEFYRKHGYVLDDITTDLTANKTDLQLNQVRHPAANFRTAHVEELDEVLTFVEQHFPSWLDIYGQAILAKDERDIQVAIDHHHIIGVALTTAYNSHQAEESQKWSLLFGHKVGVISHVGVYPPTQNQGVGTTLVAQASQQLLRRGVDLIYVSHNDRPGWLHRLGFKPWRQYQMGWKAL